MSKPRKTTPPPSPTIAPPPQGEASGQQAAMIPGLPGVMGVSLGGLGLMGGSAAMMADPLSGTSAEWLQTFGGDPYAFGRWVGQWYWGTYNTYRLIVAHPRVRQARETLTGPVKSSRWEYEKADESVPDGVVQMVREQLDALRGDFVPDALRALDYGWAPFEPIWGVKDDASGRPRQWLTRLKPLLPDVTTIQTDARGNFTGLLQGLGTIGGDATVGGPLRADGYKAWIYTYDQEAGNLYGRPLAENCRATAWRMWLDAAFQLHGIGEKLSEVIAMGFAPAGSYPDGKGGTVTPRDEMVKAMQGLKRTGMAVFTNLVAMANGPTSSVQDMQRAAQAALSCLTFHDAGNHSAAIGGELERMQHAEDLMFAGWMLSSRTGMQSQHGSRADSSQHTDTGLVASEGIGQHLAGRAQTFADWILELNAGSRYVGAVRVKQVALVDRSREGAGMALETLGADPDVAEAMVEVIDEEKLFQSLDIPVKEGASLKAALAGVKQRKAAQATAEASAKAAGAGGTAGGGKTPAGKGKRKGGPGTFLSRLVSIVEADEGMEAGYNPDEPRDDHGQWAPDGGGGGSSAGDKSRGDAKGSIGEVYDVATDPARGGAKNKAFCAYRGVDQAEADRIKQATGVDVGGYTHSVDEAAIRHVIAEHGPDGENDPSQEPLSKSDVESVAAVVADPDKTELATDTKTGLQTLKHTKRVNGHVIVVEEVRRQRKKLALKTMYKKKATNP